MKLIINKRVITAPIEDILIKVKAETGGRYLKQIKSKHGNSIMITCPWHKEGQENHPSCSVCADMDNPKAYYGSCHCFTCGKSYPLSALVAKCFNADIEYGQQWLLDNYGDTYIEEDAFSWFDSDIEIKPSAPKLEIKNTYMDETILDNYNCYHPYMSTRKLTDDVLKKFKIGYDKDADALTFPVWDEYGNLVSISRRSVTGKRFILEENKHKPVYLLNYILKENIKTVYVCESQINCLTLWSWGFPAVALFGTGTHYQYNILNRSGINCYVLCLDGDDAGRDGINRFKQNVKGFILVKDIPEKQDVNDLTKKEFENLKLF